MNVPRETIFAALFALVSGAKVNGQPAFATTSRRLRLPSEVSPAEKPALFLQQDDETADQSSGYGATRWRLSAHLFVFAVADELTAPDAVLNPLLDAIESVLRAPGFAKQTLGGLVDNCWIDAKVIRDPAPLTSAPNLIIPVSIVAGS